LTTAPIFSFVTDDRSRAEAAAWAQFSAPKDQAEFCASWLAILCTQIERVSGALLVLGPDAEGGYGAAAVWPDARRDMQYLGPMAQRTLKERRGLVGGPDGEAAPGRDEAAHVGYPIEVGGRLHGAVVLDLPRGGERDLQRAMRLLHWASAWLVDQFRQRAFDEQAVRLARLSLANELVATALQERRPGASALALANELAARLGCERVSFGFERAGSIELQAISHTAQFDRKTALARTLADAMDEVLDLDLPLLHPPLDGEAVADTAQAALAALGRSAGVCSVPLVDSGRTVGVITLERGSAASADEAAAAARPFDAADFETCKTLGLLLGPILQLERENARNPWQRSRDALAAAALALFGPGHPGLKLIGVVSLALLAVLALLDVPYRVAARTFIEGAVQRAAVAPFDGYIAAGFVRAGDTVKRGQVLAKLQDRDLLLEQTRWSAEHELAQRKLRQAGATQDRAAMAMFSAQADQAQAQLSLVQEKLARATLLAPFDGLVVLGDLSQLLGTPVEQGKLLFEIAPLDSYRVMLNVDERDIGELRVGQAGDLALPSIPGQVMPFVVKHITPISVSQDGRNYFRVEAEIGQAAARLRPGMEGVGKVQVGERRLLWIWTHGLVDWLRLALWRWWP
jgi:multidrug resistance efflux pump